MCDETWRIDQVGFNPNTFKAFEGLMTLGAPGLHVRGSLEQLVPGERQDAVYDRIAANVTSEKFRERVTKLGTYVPGVYSTHPVLNMQLVNLPSPVGIEVRAAGATLEPGKAERDDRRLDLKRAVLTREVTWRVGKAELRLTFERFVSRVRRGLLAQRVTVECDSDMEVEVAGTIDGRITTNGFDHLKGFEWIEPAVDTAPEPNQELRLRVTLDSGQTLHYAMVLCGDGESEGTRVDGRSGALVRRIKVGPERVGKIDKVTAICPEQDPADLDEVAMSFDALLAEHEAAWSKAWAACDVEIEGDARAQRAMRAALFHLLRSHPHTDEAAIDAKGYAGEAYWGRFFWDTEMYLLPFFLYTQPERARELVMFRVRTLDGARENARRKGQAGARYAWESDCRGVECCPNWQYGDHEVHVSADVVFGFEHYAFGSGDESFLHETAREAVREVGRFWMDRVDRRAGDERPHLLGVMGPDEYTPLSSDNAFTNRLAARALACAAQVELSTTESERRAMIETARGLPMLREGDLVLQCAEWRLLGEPEFERLWKDRTKTFASQVPQEKLYRTKCLKQADVLMLMALLPHEFSDREVRAAWDEYVPYTTHDSSLSAGVHMLIALRLGMVDEAWAFWMMGSGLDLEVEHGGAAEGIHIAGAGAIWQMVVLGFAGLKTAMVTSTLTLNPRLPKGWTRLRFPLAWRGSRVMVDVEPGRVSVLHTAGMELDIEVCGERKRIGAGGREQWSV